MRYRVKFRFPGEIAGYWYTEWFDDMTDAIAFTDKADRFDGIFPIAIEDENGDPQ